MVHHFEIHYTVIIKGKGYGYGSIRSESFKESLCVKAKDGHLFTEIDRGGSRKEFFDKILSVLAILGGERRELL